VAKQATAAYPSAPERRSTYIEAVAIYESAMSAFQRRDFQGAADHLQRILGGFPSETELVERARLHLSVCERHLRPPSTEPRTTEERLYAATMALNEGAVPRALSLLEPVAETDPRADQAFYLRAVAHAEQQQFDRAVDLLRRAIESNPENRVRARVDPDLDLLRRIDGVAALLEPPRRSSIEPPRPLRSRR
jgi:tetratricopeptide (TPR) repeat protein